MEGCAKIQTNRGITGNVDTTNTNSPWGTMPWPCPRRSVVKQSGQVSESRRSKQTSFEGRVKAPTRTNGPPNSARDRGPSNLKRGRQGHRHTMSIAGYYTGRCRDYNPCSRQSPGSERRGTPKGTKSLVTSRVTHA